MVNIWGATGKSVALSVSSALVLTGCGFGYFYTTDSGCGEIVPEDPFPELVWHEANGDVSGDVSRFASNVAWEVTNAPPGSSIGTGVVTSFPFDNFAKLELELSAQDGQLDPDLEYFAGDGINFIWQPDTRVTPASLNADGIYMASHSSSIFGNEIGIAGLLDVLDPTNEAAGLMASFLHLPATIVARCDEPFNDEALDTWDGPIFEVLMVMEDSSSQEIYPGRVPGVIDFQNSPTQFSIQSSFEDERIPIVASVTPIFTELLTDFGGLPDFLPSLSDYELFLYNQILWLDYFDQFQFLPGFLVTNSDVSISTIEVSLDSPLDTEFFTTQIVENFNQVLSPEEQVTIEDMPLGEVDYLLLYTLFASPGENGDIILSYDFERYYPGQDGDLVTLEVFEEQQALASSQPAAPYTGPVVTSVDPYSVVAGQTFTISGTNLDDVDALAIDGVDVVITSSIESEIVAVLPEGLSTGIKDLTISSSSGTLNAQSVLRVTEGQVSASGNLVASMRRIEDTARVSVHEVVDAGKVQIMHNGKEIAWVNAVDETDPKLRGNVGSKYLVRTIKLLPGKNALEVYVDGERIRRVAYTK